MPCKMNNIYGGSINLQLGRGKIFELVLCYDSESEDLTERIQNNIWEHENAQLQYILTSLSEATIFILLFMIATVTISF